MIEHHLDMRQIVVAPERLVQRGVPPPGHAVGIRAMIEEIGNPVEIMPVRFAQQHRVEAVGGQPTALDQHL
jgi:hypothetical protein